MPQKLVLAFFAAGCLLTAQAQISDDPGVTVSLNGATVLHRAGVPYPPAALQKGVQGTVTVSVTLDARGNVSDTQVLSGPDDFRKAVLQSVLQWHFTRDAANSTRTFQVAFETPKAEPPSISTQRVDLASGLAAPLPVRTVSPLTSGQLQSIRVVGLPDRSAQELLDSLPIHRGDVWTPESFTRINDAVKAYDEHLSIQLSTSGNSGSLEMMIIAPNGNISRIKVGGNVQGAMVLKRVTPVYPADAKTQRISGSVHLAAVIGQDGTIQSVSVLDGPSELVQAAIDAVKQWIYKPTLLNGSPVQVETTIDINFTLNQ